MSRYELKVLGLVQGVGFRPFVAKLARDIGLTGYVYNDGTGVFIDIEGFPGRLEEFLQRLRDEPPPLARISSVEKIERNPKGYRSFSVRESVSPSERFALISPDIATCEECLDESRDPSDRRYKYPFINCTNCGPRFTIVKDVPYDRIRTTMCGFPMCDACLCEYTDDTDRRFHAEPIACPSCGPSVRLVNKSGVEIPGEPIGKAIDLLKEGAIIAVKGLGGYHLACDATDSLAVSTLRKRKCREEKPLAIMVKDLDAARLICFVSGAEETLLTSPERPIVLLKKRDSIPIAGEVAPNNKYLGVMLPYTPLHHLLMEGLPALVMTSGNLTDEPLAYKDEEALLRLGNIADYFVLHDREIFTRCDDSVAKVVEGKTQMVRRSRGYVPNAITLPFGGPPIVAVGAELKNTFCLVRDNLAFVGHHIGDLKNLEAHEAFKSGIEHLKALLFIEPEIIAHDLHPDYLSTRYAIDSGLPTKAIQHHHAHIAGCMAENGINTKVIGLSFDGTGYGQDGTVWGGEFLLADYEGFDRAAHLLPVELPGGEAAINEPWRMAVSCLRASFGERFIALNVPLVERIGESKVRAISRMIERRVNSPLTSSLGRLFDAVSSLVGIRDYVSFEGQAAMELEMAASDESSGKPYPYRIVETGTIQAESRVPGQGGWRRYRSVKKDIPEDAARHLIDFRETITSVCEDVKSGRPIAEISRRFHETVSCAVTEMCKVLRMRTSIQDVCMSGGVFQNALLTTLLARSLEEAGFRVHLHSLVPANDGGIALGQAAIACFSSRVK